MIMETDTQVSEISNQDNEYSFLEKFSAQELLEWAFKNYGKRAAIGTSLQKTGIVIIDLAVKISNDYRIFFIDTLNHYKETYELLDEVEKFYGIKIERFSPPREDVEKLNREMGQFPYYSRFGRGECCKVRKMIPNEKALETLDVWISGLRADQSAFRQINAGKVEIVYKDERKIIKLNPLFDWSEEQVARYSKEKKLPYNKLYDYKSPYGEIFKEIGCVPCHIPVFPSRSKRAGKFPWETGEKECGIHIDHSDGSGI